MSEDTAMKIMEHALDLGINFIDTADVYTRGEAEKIIGRFAKGRRNDLIIATKAGKEADMYPDTPADRSSVSRKNIIYRVEQSLEKLQTDYIDLFYVHKYDPQIPLEETMNAVDYLMKEGKVRYAACSNFSAEQIAESRRVAEKLNLENFIAVQNEYSLFERGMEESVIPYCNENGLGTLAFSVLAGGVLAGRYEMGKAPPAGSRATYRQSSWLAQHSDEERFRKIDEMKKLAARAGVSLPVLSLSWALRPNGVTTVVVGASRPEQLDDCVRAPDATIQKEIISELDKL